MGNQKTIRGERIHFIPVIALVDIFYINMIYLERYELS